MRGTRRRKIRIRGSVRYIEEEAKESGKEEDIEEETKE